MDEARGAVGAQASTSTLSAVHAGGKRASNGGGAAPAALPQRRRIDDGSGGALGVGVRNDGGSDVSEGINDEEDIDPVAAALDSTFHGAPTVSGYFTWLPGMRVDIVSDGGYTLRMLKAFLGD